jgi:hypothetical protein
MAFTRQANFASGTTGATSTAVAYNGNNTLGNLLVAFAVCQGGSAPNLTDSAGNTWVQAGTTSSSGAAMFYVLSAKVGANTVTLHSTSSTRVWLALVEYANSSGTNGFDNEANNNSSVSNNVSVALTTTHANCLGILGCVSIAGGTTFTQGAGYSVFIGAASAGPAVEDNLNVGSAGSITATGTLGGGGNWAASLATFFSVSSAPSSGWLNRQRKLVNKR